MSGGIGSTLPALASLSPGAGKGPRSGAETAKDFEAMFLSQMVDQMMRTVKLGEFGGGHAEEAWRSVLSDAMAEQIAAQGNTGIAASIETSIAAYRAAGGSENG